jgi:hypothetical protein
VNGAKRALTIDRGEMPELPRRGEDSDFWFVDVDDPEMGAAKLVEIVRDRIPRRFGLDPLRDIQVLCPMQRGALGARAVNADLQKALNPDPPAKVEKFGSIVALGDKVMQSENDYDRDVFNGDLGTVLRVDEDEASLVASFDGREVVYQFGELDALVPAYATTIHKSQGSEYPAFVIDRRRLADVTGWPTLATQVIGIEIGALEREVARGSGADPRPIRRGDADLRWPTTVMDAGGARGRRGLSRNGIYGTSREGRNRASILFGGRRRGTRPDPPLAAECQNVRRSTRESVDSHVEENHPRNPGSGGMICLPELS